MNLAITAAQMRALAEPVSEAFFATFFRHLQTNFPELSETLGPEGLALFAGEARRKAESYGIDRRRDFLRFLNVCATHGIDFDNRPETEWVERGLRDSRVTSVSERLRLVTDECLWRIEVAEHNAQTTLDSPAFVPEWLLKTV